MLQTLFEIPYDVGGVPLFGKGLLLIVWAIVSVVMVAVQVRRHGWGSEIWNLLPLLALLGAAIRYLPEMFPGALPIRGYGVMLLLAVIGGLAMALHRARQMGVDPEFIFTLAFWMFVFGIVGARLFYVIEYWQEFNKDTLLETVKAVINVPGGGLVVYGSLIGGGLAFFWYVRSKRMPLLAIADLVAPSLLVGLALGRLGCLLNGCCYGGACTQPWAVTFPEGSPPYRSQVLRGQVYGFTLRSDPEGPPEVVSVAADSPAASAGLRVGDVIRAINSYPIETAGQAHAQIYEAYYEQRPLAIETADGRRVKLAAIAVRPRSLWVHPTQIYSAIGAGLLCLFLIAYYPFRRRDGEVAALLLTIYPVMRFLLEIIRTDETAVFGTGLSISQNVSLWILVAAAALWFYIVRQPTGSMLPAGPAGSAAQSAT